MSNFAALDVYSREQAANFCGIALYADTVYTAVVPCMNLFDRTFHPEVRKLPFGFVCFGNGLQAYYRWNRVHDKITSFLGGY
jgi:hypothetical protein